MITEKTLRIIAFASLVIWSFYCTYKWRKLESILETGNAQIEQLRVEQKDLLDKYSVMKERSELADSLLKVKYSIQRDENIRLINSANRSELRSIIESAITDTARYDLYHE